MPTCIMTGWHYPAWCYSYLAACTRGIPYHSGQYGEDAFGLPKAARHSCLMVS